MRRDLMRLTVAAAMLSMAAPMPAEPAKTPGKRPKQKFPKPHKARP
jgi:hypothetical protein